MTSRKRFLLPIAVAAAVALAALAWSRRAARPAPVAPAAPRSVASDAALRQARDALETLSTLEKAAVADNARAGYLVQRGSAPAPACVNRMHREQLTTHETLRALAKLPDTVPGLAALRQAVFQVHICVSCTAGADDYCARADKLLADARSALTAPH